jgi:hypothetical protein
MGLFTDKKHALNNNINNNINNNNNNNTNYKEES